MAALNDVLSSIDEFVWGVPLIVLIMGTGIYLTVRLGLLQFRKLGKALNYMVHNEEGGNGEVSSFGALCTALAATIGTGNIVGVATAVVAGGPGALFWMVIAACFGMATKYSEGLLLVTDDGKLCRRLLDPETHVEKRYFLWAAGDPAPEACAAIRGGLRLQGLPAPTKPCRFEVGAYTLISRLDVPVFPNRRPLLDAPDTPVFSARIWLTEGKRHQIKRMLEAVGCACLYLRREAFGPLELDPRLCPGQYRPLTQAELAALRAAAGLPPAQEARG